jgi:hypothetical protein
LLLLLLLLRLLLVCCKLLLQQLHTQLLLALLATPLLLPLVSVLLLLLVVIACCCCWLLWARQRGCYWWHVQVRLQQQKNSNRCGLLGMNCAAQNRHVTNLLIAARLLGAAAVTHQLYRQHAFTSMHDDNRLLLYLQAYAGTPATTPPTTSEVCWPAAQFTKKNRVKNTKPGTSHQLAPAAFMRLLEW